MAILVVLCNWQWNKRWSTFPVPLPHSHRGVIFPGIFMTYLYSHVMAWPDHIRFISLSGFLDFVLKLMGRWFTLGNNEKVNLPLVEFELVHCLCQMLLTCFLISDFTSEQGIVDLWVMGIYGDLFSPGPFIINPCLDLWGFISPASYP